MSEQKSSIAQMFRMLHMGIWQDIHRAVTWFELGVLHWVLMGPRSGTNACKCAVGRTLMPCACCSHACMERDVAGWFPLMALLVHLRLF